MNAIDPAAFVTTHTAIASAPLVPEIRLHMASELTPLWQATEASVGRTNLPPPYWAFAWPGGQALARHILDQPHLVRGRRTLDLAAGNGLAAIAAVRAGASTVTASEIDAFAAAAIALNAGLNEVSVTIAERDLLAGEPNGWAVILAGDVFYERPFAERMERWLRTAAKRGAAVLIADPGRTYLPKVGLREIARYEVPTSRELEDRDIRSAAIYTLTSAD